MRCAHHTSLHLHGQDTVYACTVQGGIFIRIVSTFFVSDCPLQAVRIGIVTGDTSIQNHSQGHVISGARS